MNSNQSKMNKFKKLINRLVLEELETQSGNDESSMAVKKVLRALESPQMKSKLQSVKNADHKADLIVRFAALVGVPSAKKADISAMIRSLGSSR
jgi:hypothetical protein